MRCEPKSYKLRFSGKKFYFNILQWAKAYFEYGLAGSYEVAMLESISIG